MPLKLTTEMRLATNVSLARLDSLIAEMERSLDIIEARLRRLTIIRKVMAVRERASRTVQ